LSCLGLQLEVGGKFHLRLNILLETNSAGVDGAG
jgi:hypothetical protein